MKKILPFILLSAILLSSCTKAEEVDFGKFLTENDKNDFYTVITNNETGEEFYELSKVEIPVVSLEEKEYSDKLAMLSEFDYETLSSEEKFSYNLIERNLVLEKSGVKYTLFEDILSVDNGVHITLVSSLCDFEIKSIEDAEKYLTLYSDAGNYIESVITYEKKRSEAGITRHINDAEIIISDCLTTAEIPKE